MTVILPGATIGLLGGGQLGRMTGYAARSLGYDVHVLDPDPACPARAIASRVITAPFTDAAAAVELARGVDVVTLEIEQIGVDVAASLLGPDGATLFSTDDPDGLQDKEILALIAPMTGELRLVVAPRDPQAASGGYRVVWAARRPAGPGSL